jgi:hypothetical protein
MRRDNRALTRYRLAADELAELIIHQRPAAITDIDIQAGEDPTVVREVVLPLVRELRRRTKLGITLCLGTLSPREYDELQDAGGDWSLGTGHNARQPILGCSRLFPGEVQSNERRHERRRLHKGPQRESGASRGRRAFFVRRHAARKHVPKRPATRGVLLLPEY